MMGKDFHENKTKLHYITESNMTRFTDYITALSVQWKDDINCPVATHLSISKPIS